MVPRRDRYEPRGYLQHQADVAVPTDQLNADREVVLCPNDR